MLTRRFLPATRDGDGLRPLDPLGLFESFYRDAARMMDGFFQGMEPWGFARDLPNIELYEKDGNIVMNAELPGIEPKDLDVQVYDDRIRISAERKHSDEDKGENYYRRETRYGSIQRVVPLPETVDPDRATAEFKNGVLKITVPKVESTRSKKITFDQP